MLLRPRPLRWALRIVGILIALPVLYLAVTFAQVWWEGRQDGARPSSAIVVMGAAQWNGVPSPVLRSRLDHAASLYRQGVAPVVIVTGGKQAGDRVTQGFAGYEYLRSQGVPDDAIKVEVDGTDSYEELSASAVIVRRAGLGDDVVIVTDPYHALRVRAIADEVGLRARVSPTDLDGSWGQYARETAAVALGRIVSFRRLAAWQ